MIAALANAPTTTPAMSRTRGSPRDPAARATTNSAAAPRRSRRRTPRAGGSRRRTPSVVAITAPTAAPPDTPSRYGSASGFRMRALERGARHAESRADEHGQRDARKPQRTHDHRGRACRRPRNASTTADERNADRADAIATNAAMREQRRDEHDPARQRHRSAHRRRDEQASRLRRPPRPSCTDGRRRDRVERQNVPVAHRGNARHAVGERHRSLAVGPVRTKSGLRVHDIFHRHRGRRPFRIARRRSCRRRSRRAR